MQSVTVQRWISDGQRDLFLKFLRPLMDANCGWLVYEIDDMMFDGTFLGTKDERRALEAKYGDLQQCSIPLFNRGRGSFEGESVQRNIKAMLNAADFITVTTDYLKHVYHDFYGVPLENIIAVPNFLPKWWIGDRYRPKDKLQQFTQNKAKPRIGIVSSLSHYNVDGVRRTAAGRAVRKKQYPDGQLKWFDEKGTEIPEKDAIPIADDIDAIIDCIRETVDDFQWVFFGYCPVSLRDLVERKKIEVHGGTYIMNYPSVFDNLKLQAVVAPINPIGFNFCKSFIKYMEAAALGIPCYATKCLPYDRVMPERQLFKDGADLKEKLMQLKFNTSGGAYLKMVEQQWQWLTSRHKEGDFLCNGFFLEDNLGLFLDRFRLRQKSVPVSLDVFVKQYEERKRRERENVIFKKGEVLITR